MTGWVVFGIMAWVIFMAWALTLPPPKGLSGLDNKPETIAALVDALKKSAEDQTPKIVFWSCVVGFLIIVTLSDIFMK